MTARRSETEPLISSPEMSARLPGGGPERRAAALRLSHDLGKYVRFSAPETPEDDAAALRERLRADLLATRRTEDETRAAPEVFEAWRKEHGALFAARPPAALDEVAGAIRAMRPLLARLDALPPAELRRLDALARDVADGCRRLVKSAAEAP